MKPSKSPAFRPDIRETLRAVGGEGTLGDLAAITGLSRREIEAELDTLIAHERAHVRVSDSGDVVYHLGRGSDGATKLRALHRPSGRWLQEVVLTDVEPGDVAATTRPYRRDDSRASWAGFERKTLQLIRAREGVISLAELVEHTGLPLAEAEEEMRRLGEWYGGVPRPSLDGHVVYAFPDLMTTALGGFPEREPRPAWVRDRDPIRASRRSRRREELDVALSLVGLAASIAAPWLVLGAAGSTVILVAGASAAGMVVSGTRLRRALEHHPLLRFRTPATLRRYLLGYVIESALAGKGIVSLSRAERYLCARARGRSLRRATVEKALRSLATEFDATITELDGELFFGFRNVKRQFLASHLVRKEMRLGRTASGQTVFDTADSPEAATARELVQFDCALLGDVRTRAKKKT